MKNLWLQPFILRKKICVMVRMQDNMKRASDKKRERKEKRQERRKEQEI